MLREGARTGLAWWDGEAWVTQKEARYLVLPLTGCRSWNKLFNLIPSFFIYKKNGNNAIFAIFCEGEMGLNEKIYGMKFPACQIPVQSAKSLHECHTDKSGSCH